MRVDDLFLLLPFVLFLSLSMIPPHKNRLSSKEACPVQLLVFILSSSSSSFSYSFSFSILSPLFIYFFSIVIKSHQTSVLDARVQFAHADSYTAPSAVACFPLWRICAFATAAGATGRGNSGTAHHGDTVATVLTLMMMMSARLSRPWFELKHLDHPLVPDFTVVRFAVHGDDEFTVVRDVERGLYVPHKSISVYEISGEEERGTRACLP